MRGFRLKKHNLIVIFLSWIIVFAAAILAHFFNSSMQAVQETYPTKQISEYENEYDSYYYGDYSIQYQPGQAANAFINIGVCLDDMETDFHKELTLQMMEEAKQYSIGIIFLDSAGDTAKDRLNINEFVMRKVKTIIWSPVDRAGTAELTYDIKKSNIPLINICNQVDVIAIDMVDAFLIPDEDEYIKLTSSAIEDALEERSGRGIAILPTEDSLLFGADISFLHNHGVLLEAASITAGSCSADTNALGCVFVAAPGALEQALELKKQTDCAIVCGYIDGTVSSLIKSGEVWGAIAASPASISQNAIRFSVDLINGEKTPVIRNNLLYIVNGENIMESADTWYLAYEEA